MRVAKVKFGYYNFGPSFGQKTLEITVDDALFDAEDEETRKQRESPLYDQLKVLVVEQGLEAELYNALNGTHNTFLAFRGGCLEKSEHATEVDEFLLAISRESLELQKTPDVSKMNMGKLRPPYMSFVGVPRVISGPRDFYQNFNNVIATVKVGDDYSELALQEMMNHQFCILVYKINSKDDLMKFTFSPRQIMVQDVSGVAAPETLALGYRYYPITTDFKLIRVCPSGS